MKRRTKKTLALLCALGAPLLAASPVAVPIPSSQAGKDTGLVDPKATPEARGLMRFLSAVYGKHVISGHQMSYDVATSNAELAKIKAWTGETPGLRGFDFMDVINSWGAPNADSGLKWGQAGGVVELNWHWRLGGKDFYSPAYHAGGTSFPSGDPETNATINADLKKLGDELQKFADAGVPVLWRPLHEPPGNWFWWHDGGADKYKRLWVHMWKYLVQERGFHNLIWVYSSSDGGASRSDWYPGDAYVDIVGVDGYGEQWQNYWNGLQGITGGRKMLAMTENKKFPPWNGSTPWLWTLAWNNEIFNALGQGDFTGHYNAPNTINYDDLPTAQGARSWKTLLPSSGDSAPIVVAQPPDRRLSSTAGRVVGLVDLAQVFRDPRGGAMRWNVEVAGATGLVASVDAAGKVSLEIAPGALGKATVRVTATNAKSESTSTAFLVYVKDMVRGDLALWQPVVASSVDAYAGGPSAAVDGDDATRWSSVYADGEWIRVDLDSAFAIDRVVLKWEDAYATAYDIEVAVDTTRWTIAKSVAAGKGGTETVALGGLQARWIRVTGRARATEYGISLWTLSAYRTSGSVGVGRGDARRAAVSVSGGVVVVRSGLVGAGRVEVRDPAGRLVRAASFEDVSEVRLAGLVPGAYRLRVVQAGIVAEAGFVLSL